MIIALDAKSQCQEMPSSPPELALLCGLTHPSKYGYNNGKLNKVQW
jgi:hypothetical protein